MDKIIVLDFGGQYCHLIARRIRDIGVYSEVMATETSLDKIKNIEGLKGIILSGGAASVYDPESPKCDKEILNIGVPILGICYGHQLIAQLEGGDVISGESGEYGLTAMEITEAGLLFENIGPHEKVWMNHRDIVKNLPQRFTSIATTKHSPVAAFENTKDKIYGVQFHPEVEHTEKGNQILENFAIGVCQANKEWDSSQIIQNITNEIKEKIGGKKAVIALSGGVDSSVAAVLVEKVIGKNLTAVYVDTGLMRYKETEFMADNFLKFGFDLKIVDAKNRFISALKGVTDPEQKRKAVGKTFIDIFNEVAEEVGADVLIQGTIYSDRIESGATKHSSRIKSHHNVGGLPKDMKLEVYEPIRELYKDEVRRLAAQLDLSEEITRRNVFPGPGNSIRILGEVTPEKADIVQRATYIVEDELRKANLYYDLYMAFAILLPIKSVGVQGDERTYKYPVVLRIIESKDVMTANFARIPYDILEKISTRITNEIKDVNRVVFDISHKPPATMEWE